MHISWLGRTCVKLQAKNKNEEDVIIMIDAYRPEKGDFPRSLSPQIALFSRGQEDAITLSQNPFIIDTLGEFEIKDMMIYSLAGPDGNLIFKVNADGLNVTHVGRLSQKLENDQIAKISNTDILILPVGGGEYISPEIATQLITTIEPRIVIPIGYRCDTDPGAKPLEDFLKEVGLKPEATDKKLIMKKKDLPTEETKLYILEKGY